MQTVKGDGINIQTAQWPGQGSTVLAVHGLTANCRCWDVVADSLAPKHNVVALDLRGRGLSDKPAKGYSLDHHVADIKNVIKELKLPRVALMGHSLGAYIGLAFAYRHPELVERLILVDGGAQLSPAQWGKVGAGIKPSIDRLGQVFPSFQDYLNLVKQAPFLKNFGPALETYFRYESEDLPEGGVRSRINPAHIVEERANLAQADTSAFYRGIKCPVLVLRATQGMVLEDDFVLPDEAVAQLKKDLPQAQVVALPGVNHFNMIFEPSPQRDQALDKFLG